MKGRAIQTDCDGKEKDKEKISKVNEFASYYTFKIYVFNGI